MANKLPVITENVLRTKGIEVHQYTSDLKDLKEMQVGQVFGFKEVQGASLYAVKSARQRDSFGVKKWDVLGVDCVERVYFVKRMS